MSGEVKQLGVEAETFNRLLLKDQLASFAAESFEAALGVDKWQSQHDADDAVKHDAGEFTKKRFMSFDQAPVNGAGADGHVISSELGNQFVRFFDGRGKVRIRKKNDSSLCFQRAVTNAVALTSIRTVLYHAKSGDAIEEGTSDGDRAIGGAIVHDDDLRLSP